jgi:low affinity Fe/Cu permease
VATSLDTSPGQIEAKGLFDSFASNVTQHVSRAWFFSACVLMIVLWIPTLFMMPFDSSQLIINTATTIITFLLVALLENTQDRTAKAQNHKLDALIVAVADLLDERGGYEKEVTELRRMAGVEMEAGN